VDIGFAITNAGPHHAGHCDGAQTEAPRAAHADWVNGWLAPGATATTAAAAVPVHTAAATVAIVAATTAPTV